MPHLTALVTLLAIALYFYTGLLVGQARRRTGIKAPATTGDPAFERVFRVQMNMLEWMPIALPALWLFAVYISDAWCGSRGGCSTCKAIRRLLTNAAPALAALAFRRSRPPCFGPGH